MTANSPGSARLAKHPEQPAPLAEPHRRLDGTAGLQVWRVPGNAAGHRLRMARNASLEPPPNERKVCRRSLVGSRLPQQRLQPCEIGNVNLGPGSAPCLRAVLDEGSAAFGEDSHASPRRHRHLPQVGVADQLQGCRAESQALHLDPVAEGHDRAALRRRLDRKLPHVRVAANDGGQQDQSSDIVPLRRCEGREHGAEAEPAEHQAGGAGGGAKPVRGVMNALLPGRPVFVGPALAFADVAGIAAARVVEPKHRVAVPSAIGCQQPQVHMGVDGILIEAGTQDDRDVPARGLPRRMQPAKAAVQCDRQHRRLAAIVHDRSVRNRIHLALRARKAAFHALS